MAMIFMENTTFLIAYMIQEILEKSRKKYLTQGVALCYIFSYL